MLCSIWVWVLPLYPFTHRSRLARACIRNKLKRERFLIMTQECEKGRRRIWERAKNESSHKMARSGYRPHSTTFENNLFEEGARGAILP